MLHQQAEQLMTNMQYEEAATIYLRMLRELPGSYNLKFRIGYCYLYSFGRTGEAISYLEKASANVSFDSDPGSLRDEAAPADCFLLLGIAYQRNGQFDQAGDAYNRYMEIIPEDHYRQKLANQYLKSIENARSLMAGPLILEKSNLGREINSNASNVNAVLSGDGRTMAYTNITRRGFDVYIVRKEGERWGRPRNIGRQLRRDYLLTSGLSYDGNELYLVYYLPDASDIYHSVFEDGDWSRARRFGSPVNSRHNETHASVSADGLTLYFTSSRPGGFGGLDIYRATLDSRGRWRNVENLGPDINTPFNEDTPFITAEGNKLFFSSEGHNSMGGYDVFYVDLTSPSEVHNLGYPINNADDNIFYFPVDNGRTGYISFWDEQGFGQKDIYLVNIPDTGPLVADLDQDTPAKAEPYLQDTLFVPDTIGLPETYVSDEQPFVTEVAEYEEDAYIPSTGVDPFVPVRIPLEYDEEPRLDDRTYNVQYMALERDVEAVVMEAHAGNGEFVLYGRDRFSRFVSVFFDTRDEAMEVLPDYLERGYIDAFIRENIYSPNYTIQLAAMKNFIRLDSFGDLSEIACFRGKDGLYRYSWGYFSTYEDAALNIENIRAMGFYDAFIRLMQDNR